MASAFAGIEIGKRSLDAHNQSITTAGHNITNAGTEGYSRQRVQVKTFEPIYRPDLSRAGVPGQIGQGAVAESVNRVRDEMLDQRITAQTNQESFWATREKYMQMLEQIYNEPADVSIRSNMDKFWEGWQELSVHPESQAARQAVVTRANTLTESIQQRFESLSGVGNLINGDIEATVRQVNSFASQIAELNNEIVRSRAMGDNPNDLLDRRDLLVDKLASLVNVSSDQRDSDEFMVHVDGHILVQGNVARSLDTVTPGDNNGYSKVIWKDTGLNAEISGGSLGALIGLRDVDVREEINAFDKLKFESDFQVLSTGGAISYVEIPNMQNNLEALEELVKFIYNNIQYAEFNTKSDYCHVCGYDGEIIINDNLEWECPNCHNKDKNKMNVTRRTCGYLGENFWNVGKTKEIKARVLHL